MPVPDHIAFIAGQLLPQFIPKDTSVNEFSFQFTMVPSSTYRVSYVKKTEKGKAVWDLSGYETIAPEK